MNVYVDTSTFLKLAVAERGSSQVERLWAEAARVESVRLLQVESSAALSAARRAGRLSPAAHRHARAAVDHLLDEVALLEVDHALVARAATLAEDEGLRGHDAVHLAGAVAGGVDVFSSADGRLCDAARRVGLHVANPLDTGG